MRIGITTYLKLSESGIVSRTAPDVLPNFRTTVLFLSSDSTSGG